MLRSYVQCERNAKMLDVILMDRVCVQRGSRLRLDGLCMQYSDSGRMHSSRATTQSSVNREYKKICG